MGRARDGRGVQRDVNPSKNSLASKKALAGRGGCQGLQKSFGGLIQPDVSMVSERGPRAGLICKLGMCCVSFRKGPHLPGLFEERGCVISGQRGLSLPHI